MSNTTIYIGIKTVRLMIPIYRKCTCYINKTNSGNHARLPTTTPPQLWTEE